MIVKVKKVKASNMPNWLVPTTAKSQHKVHIVWAWAWFAFGVLGLVDYVFGTATIAQSIPALFFISVYANFASHLAASQAARNDDELDNQDETT